MRTDGRRTGVFAEPKYRVLFYIKSATRTRRKREKPELTAVTADAVAELPPPPQLSAYDAAVLAAFA